MATLEQIEQALRAADAAGNTDDARRLAQAYADMRGQQQGAPQGPAAPPTPADQQPLEIDVSGGTPGEAPSVEELDALRGGTAKPNPANSSAFARMVSGQAAEPQVQEGNAVGRFLGEYGGRQFLQGAANLYGQLGGDALNHYVLDPIDRAAGWGTQLGTGGRTYHDAAAQVADEMGMRRPQTARDRVYSDIGEALTGTGLTMGIGAGVNALTNLGRAGAAAPVTNRLADLLTANPALQTISTATGAGASSGMREAGGGTGMQIMAGLLGGLGPGAASGTAALAGRTLAPNRLAQLIPEAVGAVPTAVAGATRRALRGQDTQGLRDTIAAFDAAGTTPSVGQATGSRIANGLETFAGNFPGGAGRIAKLGEQQREQVRGRIDEMSNAIAPSGADLTPQQVGTSVQQGITGPGGFVQTFRNNSKKLYGALDQFMPPTTRVAAQKTDAYLSNITAPTTGATNTSQVLANPFMDRLAEAVQADLAANNGALPYSALKGIRSMVGEKIAGAGLNPDFDVKQLRGLYASLSDDMTDAVRATGNPRAIQLMERANNYYKMGSNRIEQIEKIIDKNGGPEAAYVALFNGAQNGATPLRRVMGALPQEARAEVTASFLQRMGRAAKGQQDATGDAFSMRTFLTNWANLSPEARKELFRSARYGSAFRDDVDKIARVAESIDNGSKVFQNTSGTSRQIALGSVITAVPAAAGAAMTGNFTQALMTLAAPAGAVGIANLSARTMTNPRVVAWLAHNTNRDAGDLVAQLQTLRSAGERAGDDETVELADELMQRTAAASGGRSP
ncbi:hypothetical protein HDC36_003383 [Xanthomonas sp. JAI131]|uniref:hypothetical protein n=1 Tax=Xanthomonas sp. JAI131 TaxID=2723067 RepID=UPI0015CEEDDB|nr:hypothetical protein [Xanthomonas sp. JAI131]NYF21907.1 hypothetical protein [Xanthomonas sp. JAI131]